MMVQGLFESYGQKLEIERGRLGFSGAPDNPSLDLLAVKRVDRQRVGVQVRGNAKRPVARLYSDPALDQSETLSYLVLGRPLLSASGAEAQQLGEYAQALEVAGGSLLAGSIGKRLGLSAGVESFGAAIGSALVVGKYLSPRFFVGFGTSLVDSTQIMILRFRISEHIDAEALSAQEQRVSVNWRRER
jgi:translocation and assembly module TamB